MTARTDKPDTQWTLGRPWGPKAPRTSAGDLPFVFVNVAISADGKLAPSRRNFVPFSSRTDRVLMLELRTYADAIMSGARTIDLNPVTLSNGGRRFTELRRRRRAADYPFRIVVSGRGTLRPDAEIFRHRFSPIIVLVSEAAPERHLRALRKQADAVGVFGEAAIDFPKALRWLKAELGIQSLLCEGGGEVNGGFFAADLVDEIYLTVCPVIFGGSDSPTLADGRRLEKLADAQQFTLSARQLHGSEMFLVYRRKA